MSEEVKNRRPIRSRNTRWAHWAAKLLQQKQITPNFISAFSVFCALIAAVAFGCAFRSAHHWVTVIALLCAVAGMQARLVCNLLDGMVAIEGGMHSPIGAIYNELPDRISDILIFVGMGYGLTHFPCAAYLGWAAALFAVMTAYVRLLGGTCGLEQRFLGPMAKQQRMALLTVGSVAAIVVAPYSQWILYACLWVVAVGSAVTVAHRVRRISKDLREQSKSSLR